MKWNGRISYLLKRARIFIKVKKTKLVAIAVLLSLALLLFLHISSRAPYLDTSSFPEFTNEKTIRGRITPLHVVLKCSSFDTRKSPSSLLDRLQAAVRQYGGGDDVPCGPSTEGGSLHPWWALPSSKTNQTRKDNYLLVQAVLAVDSDRRVFRNAQRDTVLRYNGAATRRSGFRGEVLYLYVMSAHYSTEDALHVQQYVDATTIVADKASLIPDNPPEALQATPFAVEEALKYMDVLWINDMTDPRPAFKRAVGEEKYWGKAIGFIMAAKFTLFLLYASYQFPHTPFVGRIDDDSFVKIPQLLLELNHMQLEVNDFNRNSRTYNIRHVNYGQLRRFRSTSLLYPPGHFIFFSNSIVQETTKFGAPASRTESQVQQESREAVKRMILLTLTPFDMRKKRHYLHYCLFADDTMVVVLLSWMDKFFIERSKEEGRDKVELIYYRKESLCRIHNIVTYAYNANPDRRKSFSIHGIYSPRMYYEFFLYFSDPSKLFHRTDEDTLRFTQALRWEDDTAYDRIDFTALAQSPLWKELFPPDPAAREAALDASHPWWEATHTMNVEFIMGVAVGKWSSEELYPMKDFPRRIQKPEGHSNVRRAIGAPLHPMSCRQHINATKAQSEDGY